MQQDPSLPPGPPDRGKRRTSFFKPDAPVTARPAAAGPPSPTPIDAALAEHQRVIQLQLDEGLRAIATTANRLMHEVAAEVWRTAGGDKDEIRETILQDLSRDQSIRSLIAHSDERFQALAVRAARLEDTMNLLAESVRAAKEQLGRGVEVLTGAQANPGMDVAHMRAQLAEVTKELAGAVGMLAERDEAIVESVRARVTEHGEAVVQEMSRISRAMEAYVQQGVEAMGQLAGSMDAQAHVTDIRDDQVAEKISAAVDEQMTLLGEQLQLLYERMSVDTTTVNESLTHLAHAGEERSAFLELMHERTAMQARDVTAAMNRSLEIRARGLAELIRSDSEALRRQLVSSAEDRDAAIATALDERLGRVTDAVSEATGRMTDELARRIREEAEGALGGRIDSSIARFEAHSEAQALAFRERTDDQSRLIDERLNEAITSIDRTAVRMSDTLEGGFERLGRSLGEQTVEAAEAAAGRDRGVREAQGRELRRAIDDGRAETEATLVRAVDTKVAAIAKLIRSDNETLAQQIVADQEASKQALRAMKELQASLPNEVIETIEERFVSLAESIERSNEMLAKRIDKMADTIGKRQNDDIQVVIDRMGDAMHALASLGRDPSEAAPTIEVE